MRDPEVQAGHHGFQRDPAPGLQDQPPHPVLRHHGPAGGGQRLPRRAVRGHLPMHHPQQQGHHPATATYIKGYI